MLCRGKTDIGEEKQDDLYCLLPEGTGCSTSRGSACSSWFHPSESVCTVVVIAQSMYNHSRDANDESIETPSPTIDSDSSSLLIKVTTISSTPGSEAHLLACQSFRVNNSTPTDKYISCGSWSGLVRTHLSVLVSTHGGWQLLRWVIQLSNLESINVQSG